MAQNNTLNKVSVVMTELLQLLSQNTSLERQPNKVAVRLCSSKVNWKNIVGSQVGARAAWLATPMLAGTSGCCFSWAMQCPSLTVLHVVVSDHVWHYRSRSYQLYNSTVVRHLQLACKSSQCWDVCVSQQREFCMTFFRVVLAEDSCWYVMVAGVSENVCLFDLQMSRCLLLSLYASADSSCVFVLIYLFILHISLLSAPCGLVLQQLSDWWSCWMFDVCAVNISIASVR